ncbi:hypothetical protein EMIHUDRAFT_198838 [Emiliania huxleyi CCMP1516]|uniref:Uncharacterized protein n=2 Tax=Emiliania huxleyi TaxID=2903 RepID=A0A0D3I1U9_EMIH1|nr:hypothetical protein EMIHUDRAFT_198838 [Emiliania huxleyi CCMP1516]EOD05234.1 hypothetical protein EMIHUDRAFT_198838 [Emiliania huxleyi CCMP1516]|eukprot:XP_005757663.1 hypothetical protein EMIHUDRAFT_198838 [Emiliania huxleyi CCMP1516]
MLDLVSGSVPVPSGVTVTKAVAIQIYLLFQERRLRHLAWKDIFFVIASLSLGYAIAAPSEAAIMRLRRTLYVKSDRTYLGLVADYKERMKKRSRDEMLKQLDQAEAQRHLMQLYDREPLNFSFAEVAGGGGGGDPGGSGTATTAPAPTQPAPGPLDVRTRTLATQLTLMAAGAHCDFAKGTRPYFWDRTAERWVQSTGPTGWSDRLGELPLDVLRIIDGTVRQVKLSRARRAETHELQAIALRKQLDDERRRTEELVTAAQASKRGAERTLRQAAALRDQAADERRATEAAMEAARREHEMDLKEARAAAAAKYNVLRAEARAERVTAGEKITELERIITELERGLRGAKVALRAAGRQAVAAADEAASELERAMSGRVWSAVREADARREAAEKRCNDLQDELEELQQQLGSRSQSRQRDAEQLKYFKKRTEDLQAKIAAYDMRANRRFYDIEPIAEENALLREQLAEARAEAAKYKGIAEPDASHFRNGGGYTLEHDLTRFYRIKLPTHVQRVPHKKVAGKMTYVERTLLYVGGKTHVKEVCAVLNQAHKLQVGVQLLESPNDSYCYISDGAESLQTDYLAQLLSRRDASGRLQTIAPTPPSCVAEGEDGPTCAHHGIVNIFEGGRKEIDKVLKAAMNITEEQSAADAAKIKNMRTHVGWFSSPSCSLIYQTVKYTALFSSKGYAVGSKFRQWILTQLAAQEGDIPDDQLLGSVEDLLAICGSRDYVFFMNAAVTERFSQDGSLLTFLEEEDTMGAEAGGKLRKSILLGFRSDYIMAAVRAMALICDSALWELLRAIGSDTHILDILPVMWPETLAFFEAAAAAPSKVVDGSLTLSLSVAREAKVTPRATRAAIDIARIREKAAGDTIIEKMLSSAFTAMAEGTRNHASEFLPGGNFCSEKITDELRQRLSGMPTTSTSAERTFALGRDHDQRAGACRDDTRSGAILGAMDNTHEFMRGREKGEEEWRMLRRLARRGMKETMAEKRIAAGRAAATERNAKLEGHRAKQAAKKKELARLEAIPLATRYSELKGMVGDELVDQLRKHKLLGKKGFTVTQPNREAYFLQLQTLLLEADPAANDLEDGDSGITGRGIRKKSAGGGGKRKKKKKGVIYYMDYEWTEEEQDDFEVSAIVGKVVADGKATYANQGKAKVGTVLYRVVWKDFPPDLVWYEPEDNLGEGYLKEYEARVAAEAAADEESAREDAELEELEEAEALARDE